MSERDAFEAIRGDLMMVIEYCETQTYIELGSAMWDGMANLRRYAAVRARAPQAVPALTEPVAEVVSAYGDPEAFGEREIRALADLSRVPYGTKLYAAPQPSPEKCFRCGHAAHHGSCVNVAPRSED